MAEDNVLLVKCYSAVQFLGENTRRKTRTDLNPELLMLNSKPLEIIAFSLPWENCIDIGALAGRVEMRPFISCQLKTAIVFV